MHGFGKLYKRDTHSQNMNNNFDERQPLMSGIIRAGRTVNTQNNRCGRRY